MEEKVLIVKYGEIAMRGKNRQLFINRIISTIRKNIDPFGNYYVEKDQGRLIVVDKSGEIDFDIIVPRITCIFGIICVCPAIKTNDNSIENLCRLGYEHFKKYFSDSPLTFKVETKRGDKRYPMISREISAEVGGYILERMNNVTVDIHNPEQTLWVEVRNYCYIYSKMIYAYGGLPFGSSGKGTSLLSGGIDSPVATWLMAKRGVEVSGVYFHSPPYTSDRAKQKVIDLAERISDFTGSFKLYVVPFTDLQLYLLDNVPHDKLTIFLKRAMMRAAQSIALSENSLALITGESVGQVASQTLQGINAIDAACTMPVMRPLSGMDKQEIIDIARKIGTFDISIRPYEDCCTIFVAKHPEVRPKTSVIEGIEKKLDKLNEYLNKSLECVEIYNFPDEN